MQLQALFGTLAEQGLFSTRKKKVTKKKEKNKQKKNREKKQKEKKKKEDGKKRKNHKRKFYPNRNLTLFMQKDHSQKPPARKVVK